jgi:hypothetical protein
VSWLTQRVSPTLASCSRPAATTSALSSAPRAGLRYAAFVPRQVARTRGGYAAHRALSATTHRRGGTPAGRLDAH